MSRKGKSVEQVPTHLNGCCLPILNDYLRHLISMAGEAISREIERGTRNTQIADYLREHVTGDPRSLERVLWVRVIAWLETAGLGSLSDAPEVGDLEPPEAEGGGSCLIV